MPMGKENEKNVTKNENVTKNKTDIRKRMLKQREMMDALDKKKLDNEIFNKLINTEYYKNAKIIFTFVSFRNEVDTHKLINYAINDNKVICVPKIESKEKGIELYKIESFDDLEVGYYKILEPIKGCEKISGDDIDLIIMPGLAFDKNGGRVGYGGGYYDKFLKEHEKNSAKRIAIAYGWQILDEVPTDNDDEKIDAIITDEEIIVIN